MTHTPDNRPPLEPSDHVPRLLDRLVDGELDRDGQRRLLAHIESNNQWRDLALAFLEAQAWQQDLGALRQPALPAEPVAEPVRPAEPVAPSRRNIPATSWLTLAVAVLVAFGVGFQIVAPVAGPWPHASGGLGDTPGLADSRGVPSTPEQADPDPWAQAPEQLAVPVRFFELELADGRSQSPMRVPVSDGQIADDYRRMIEHWDRQRLPELRRRLAGAGRQIQEQRVRVPVDLGGGRVGWITYTEIHVRPLERGGFQ